MRWKPWMRRALAAAAACLLLPLGLGSSPGAAAASPPTAASCGSGDHGLLQDLQKKHSEAGREPLHFTDIQFLSRSTGRAAGTGFILGTSDAECHWQTVYEGPWQFGQIDFTDNVHGWALASLPSNPAPVLLRTADGGSHWKGVYTGKLHFERIQFLSAKTGFGYTATGAYRTDNGCNGWMKVPTPANTRYSVFNDTKTGYALTVEPGQGYRIYQTRDGGRSWAAKLKVKAASTAGGQIYSKDNQVWAILYGDSGMSQVSYSLYGSTDQGSHWKRVIAQDTAGGGPAPGSGKATVSSGPAQPGGHPGNMQLYGKETAILAGGSPAGGMVSIGVTYDGGNTWKNIKPSVNGFDARISFVNAKTGWMAVTSATKASIYSTQDGGATWSRKFAFREALQP